MKFYHVDVFSKDALSGNGLTVIFVDENLESTYMLKIAQEFKQFETIFLLRKEGATFQTKIFTVEEELDFAGHPILGAGAVIHEEFFRNEEKVDISFELNNKTVQVESTKEQGFYECCMNQGQAEFIQVVDKGLYNNYLSLLNLTEANLSSDFPMEVVSTGLPYLIIPICYGLEQVKFLREDLESRLEKIGAKFVYIFDINRMEGRTWDNLGKVEDVATGSAAGPVGAYLYKRKYAGLTEGILLKQGSFLNRPSVIKVCMNPFTKEMFVSGYVKILVRGEII